MSEGSRLTDDTPRQRGKVWRPPDSPPPTTNAPLRIEAHPDVVVRIVGYVSEAELADRLGTITAYAARLRSELASASDDIVALRAERDGLRQRLRQAETNVEAARRGDVDRERSIEHEVRRRLDRMMRERPRVGRGGDDE